MTSLRVQNLPYSTNMEDLKSDSKWFGEVVDIPAQGRVQLSKEVDNLGPDVMALRSRLRQVDRPSGWSKSRRKCTTWRRRGKGCILSWGDAGSWRRGRQLLRAWEKGRRCWEKSSGTPKVRALSLRISSNHWGMREEHLTALQDQNCLFVLRSSISWESRKTLDKEHFSKIWLAAGNASAQCWRLHEEAREDDWEEICDRSRTQNTFLPRPSFSEEAESRAIWRRRI